MPDALIADISSPVEPVGHVLGNLLTAPFHVPRYQRGYAWKEDNVLDFIKDVRGLAARLANLPAGESADEQLHFFGAILTIEHNGEPPLRKTYELVDGQQRLTTFVSALTLVRRSLLSLAAEAATAPDGIEPSVAATASLDAADLEKLLSITVKDKVGARSTHPRLRLSKDDDPYFQAILAGGAVPKAVLASNQLLEAAVGLLKVRLIEDWLATDSPSTPRERHARLSVLQTAMLEHCALVHMSTTRRGLGYRLFMVLNDRGQPLSVSDLLRTRTMELLEDSDVAQEQAAKAWSALMSHGTEMCDAFLRDLYQSRTGERAPSSDLFDTLDQYLFSPLVKGEKADVPALVSLIEGMRDEMESYLQIREGKWPFGAGRASLWERQRLELLVKTLRQSAALPLLMSMKATRNETEFKNAVFYLERVAFRWNQAGAHAGTLGEELFRQAAKVRKDAAFSLSDIQTALGPLIAKAAPDVAFAPGLRTRMRYTASKGPLKYLLLTLDGYFEWWRDGAKGIPQLKVKGPYELGHVHLEHVYPQNPPKGDVVSSLEPVKHQLGNLTIWHPDDNQRALNKPYATKKAKYAKSFSPVTRALGTRSKSTWNSRDVADREKELVNLALRVFAVPMPAVGVIAVPSPAGTSASSVLAAPSMRAFFVQQNPGSRYQDLPGRAYDYPPEIPNAQAICPGDVLVTYLGSKVAPDGKRITGIGRVGDVYSAGSGFVAVYDRHVAFSPALTFGVIGGDPRSNQRNAINELDPEVVELLLETVGLKAIEEAEVVNGDVDKLIPELAIQE